MADDLLSAALTQASRRNLSVIDLIRIADGLKQSDNLPAAQALYAVWTLANADNPLFYAVLFNYSVLLSEGGNLAAARETLEKAVIANPDFVPAHINLGRLLEQQGHIDQAITQWSQAVEKLGAVNGTNITHKTTALNQLARTLEASNRDELAESMLRQSLEIDPRQREVSQHLTALRQRQCEWPVIVPWDRVDRNTLMTGMSPLSAGAYSDDPLFQLGLAARYNRLDVGDPLQPVFRNYPAALSPGPLRIGYLSSDLREHAVGHLTAEIFALHDRTKVEIFAYFSGPPVSAKDPLHERFRQTAHHWRDITKVDDATAARMIADDGIQILVDLNGYTREGRIKLVALRPAPVIVNWLGYPGSMGSPCHHYILADDWIIPPELEHYYSEKVMRLACYQPNDRKRVVADWQPTRRELSLPEEGTVFCCFNGSQKITRFTLDRWLTILAEVPDSVLWLLSATPQTEARLKACAAGKGLDPERLIFAAKMANPFHLARYRQADLFLDTTPYGAHTTASDALWMGVPVLTWSGRSFASRVCGSLTRAAGVPELVVDSPADYVAMAIELGRDRTRLAPYRARLEAGRDSCTLFDTPALVRRMEELYGEMWQAFEDNRLPTPDLTNLEIYLELAASADHETVEMQTVTDYEGHWRELIALRSAGRPFGPDKRLNRPRSQP